MNLLYEKYADILYYKICSVIDNREIANAVLERTLVSIWANYSTFNPAKENFYAFVMRMALYSIGSVTHYKLSAAEKMRFLSTESDLVGLIFFGNYTREQIVNEFSIAPDVLNTQLRVAVNKLRKVKSRFGPEVPCI